MVDGKQLTFRLAGINNQNFVMEDLGDRNPGGSKSPGQPSSGRSRGDISHRLNYDQLTFATWRSESPGGRVLPPGFEDRGGRQVRPHADWETRMLKNAAPASAAADTRLEPRAARHRR